MWALEGAEPADCLLAAVDQKAGLLQCLGLRPVLALVGIARGPALSSDVDSSWAVAAARQAAVLGVPALAVCLATPSPAAPVQPAVVAAAVVAAAAARVLAGAGGWPAAANFPRAHFPFPTRGRWSLGRELPLPQPAPTASLDALSDPADCWALGDDMSWQQPGSAGTSDGSATQSETRFEATEAHGLIAKAFADADVFLCINVPPKWQGTQPPVGGMDSTTAARPLFAAARPGVLWHCYQVEAPTEDDYRNEGSQASKSGGGGGGSSAAGSSLSWRAEQQDLFGRSLPRQQVGSEATTAGAFVSQDNTSQVASKVMMAGYAETAADGGSFGQAAASGGGEDDGAAAAAEATAALPRLPSHFTLLPGTMLNDAATSGDVEAVFSGRVSVTTLQTWPCGHPFSLRDEVLVHALDEGPDGLPRWLAAD